MNTLKMLLKKILPETLVLQFHLLKSIIAMFWYGRPSRKLLVIGITGTKGKSTTANFLWSIFQASGKKTGLLGTANIKKGNTQQLNTWHMTMPSPFIIQNFLRDFQHEGGEVAVLEFTSEGAKQYRHIGIDFDGAVFLNLSPEHLQSHGGSFEQYKKEKQKLFASLGSSFRKIFRGKKIPKIMAVNKSAEEKEDFLKFSADKKYFFHLLSHNKIPNNIQNNTPCFYGYISQQDNQKTTLVIDDNGTKNTVDVFLPGEKNAENALAAISIARAYHLSWENISQGMKTLQLVPGRMERIDEGQEFTVFIDYAHEEKSMEFVLQTGKKMLENTSGRLLVLLGAEGGGRDTIKREKMGALAGKMADIIMVSNVDPYDENPLNICEDIAHHAEQQGKTRGKDLFVIEDRRQGIHNIFALAKKGDVVFITGKGSEQSMIIGSKKIPWDDRKVVREELRK